MAILSLKLSGWQCHGTYVRRAKLQVSRALARGLSGCALPVLNAVHGLQLKAVLCEEAGQAMLRAKY